MKMTPLDGALEMIALGFAVFPLRPGTKKGHYYEHWKEEATRDPARVRAWPRGCNFGVWCLNFIVIDVDIRDGKEGLMSFMALAGPNGEQLPVTRVHVTPSGGLHYIFKGPNVSNRSKGLGSGIDVRSGGGYIMALGSTFEGKPYEVSNPAPIAEAPQWLIDKLPDVERKEVAPDGVEIDSEAAIARAVTWLEARPVVYQGERGSSVYKAASQLRDWGVSRGKTVELIQDHYACEFVPPFDAGEDETEITVKHAFEYAQNAAGSSAIEAYFSPVDPAEFAPAPRAAMFRPLGVGRDPVALPKREWIADGMLLRRYINLLVSPPGVGKSSLELAYAMAVACGDGDFIGLNVRQQCNTLLINMEDDEDELLRRYHALCIQHGIDPASLDGKLHIYDAATDHDPLTLLRRVEKGRLSVTAHVQALRDYIVANNIGAVFMDPLVELHEGDENSNSEGAQLMKELRKLAQGTNVALMLVHHTRKPPMAATESYAGSLDAGRGASAIGGAVRIAYTLFSMGPDEAAQFGVQQQEARRYVRLDNSKASYSAFSDMQWLRHETVEIPNGEKANALARVDMRDMAAQQHLAILTLLIDAVRNAGDDGLAWKSAISVLKEDELLAGMKPKALEALLHAALASETEIGGAVLVVVETETKAGAVSRRIKEG